MYTEIYYIKVVLIKERETFFANAKKNVSRNYKHNFFL